jgi:lipopolysaccharide transport system ATP-binding protein
MATIMNLCKRTILLDSGKLVADGQTPEVVRQYMGIKKNKSCEVSWNDINSAPGNDQVRLKSVRILSDNGLPILEADIDKDILIEMSYFNLKEGAKLLSSIHLVSNYGVTVLSSFNAPSASLTFDPWYEKPRPKGLYRTVCRIPANFLNDGSYFVNVYIATYEGARIAQVAQDRVISFDVIDTGQMRKEFSGTWVGAVRPRLAWKTELLSEF